VLRLVGEQAAPEWISNVNPFVVVVCVVLITQLMKKAKAITSITVGMFIMPFSAVAMASGSLIQQAGGNTLSVFGLFEAHPITVMMIAGIVLQGLAECFISPRYYEFFSLQAPKGEEGLYLGFGHLHSFLASLLGFGLSGYLLTNYCPDPKTVPPEMLAHVYDNAHYIWYYFSVIGFVAGVALVVYQKVVKTIDSRNQD
jgi:MFS family permease